MQWMEPFSITQATGEDKMCQSLLAKGDKRMKKEYLTDGGSAMKKEEQPKQKRRHTGIRRYLLHRSTMLMACLVAVFLTMKNSFISTEPDRSLFYEVFTLKQENWPETTGLIGSAIFQMNDICSVSTWLIIFLPFFAAYPFVTILCDDFHSNFIRSAAIRIGCRRYMRRVFRYGIASIFLIGTLALGVFSIFCYLTCYHTEQLPLQDNNDLYRVVCGQINIEPFAPESYHYILPVLGRYLIILFVMLIAGITSFLFAAVTKNKYFSLCVPCLVYYFLIKMSEVMTDHGLAWGEYISPMAVFHHVPGSAALVFFGICMVLLAEEVFVCLIGREADYLAC